MVSGYAVDYTYSLSVKQSHMTTAYPIISSAAWAHCERLLRPVLGLAPVNYLGDVAGRLADYGIQDAVAACDTPVICEWILCLIDRQGISNAAALAFAERHGGVRWLDVTAALSTSPRCPLLRSHWHFDGCRYRKDQHTCARPDLLDACALPRVGSRKGSLSQAAVGLALFVRDVCDGDIVGWFDHRLETADPGHGHPQRASLMRAALIEPLCDIPGSGRKTWSMILAELLLVGDLNRERWVTTGANFLAIDSLLHNYFHRTGILECFEARHPYGAACYESGGCASVIRALAGRIDAREFNTAFPRCFPRWVQYAIWLFCAEGGWGVCNGRRINDKERCEQQFCPAFRDCKRIAIKPPV